MRSALLAGIAIVSLAAVATAGAGDIPSPAYKASVPAALPASWTGFYLGGHVGAAWGTQDYFDPFAGKTILSNSVNGFVGGVQGGFNYQMGWVVVGIEGDFSWADAKGKATGAAGGGTGGLSANVDRIASLAGRIGGTVDRALLYIKGGVGGAHDKYTCPATGPFGAGCAFGVNTPAVSYNKTGLLLGAGVEYAFTSNWSGKIEYDFMDLGTKTVQFCPPGACTRIDISQSLHLVKAGINYKF